jgi:hypothetical protein
VAEHQLKVTLVGYTPTIWRRLQVGSATTLAELHEVLQIAMGWENLHLHAFEAGWDRYDGSGSGEARATLAEVLPNVGSSMVYVYDFGDDWRHLIGVERVLVRGHLTDTYPRCIAGGRACPPEDSGGPWSYADMLKALRARKGPRYHEIKEGLPRRFDPEAFDLSAVNDELARLGEALPDRDA